MNEASNGAAHLAVDSAQLHGFAARVIAWQRSQGRHDLPWQGSRDPYRVWLSEIMLQQTQVTTAVDYYRRFLTRFPDVTSLAAAPLDAVLEAWAGLGYYARARNLHRCAQAVVAQGGEFPRTPEALAALPGIGRTTAAAIAAFSFGARAAILDGNVKRVLARCFAIEGFPGSPRVERELWALAERLLPETGIEAYTQGLMDLGAGPCRRRQPFCPSCPLYDECLARQHGRQAELPEPRPSKRLPEREAELAVLSDGAQVLLERRPASGLWGGLLALPERDALPHALIACGEILGAGEALPALRHTFSHFHWQLRPRLYFLPRLPPACGESGRWVWLPWAAIDTAALPTPIRRILRDARTRCRGE